MARAVPSSQRCIYGLSQGQLQTLSCSPHMHTSTKLAARQQSPAVRRGNSLCGAQSTLRGGHRPSVGHPTAKLPWHFPSRSHNLHMRSRASLCNVLKSFDRTEAEKPSLHFLLAWLVLGLFFWERKETNKKQHKMQWEQREALEGDQEGVQVCAAPGYGNHSARTHTPALSCRRVRQ